MTRRDGDHEIADLAPRDGLEVLADRAHVPGPPERARLDIGPGEARERGEGAPGLLLIERDDRLGDLLSVLGDHSTRAARSR